MIILYAARTGWVVINNSDHYFYKSGKMVKNSTIKIDGDYYSFDSDGNIIGLNREEVALSKAIATYITQFKNPSSVKIVGEVKKFDKAEASYIKENLGTGYGTVSGYLLNVSATNGFGGRTTTEYYLITDKSGFKNPARYSDIPSYGFISIDEDPFPYALIGVASFYAEEINVDVKKVNNTIAEYVESIGY